MEKIEAPTHEKEGSKIKFEASVKSGYDVLHIEDMSKSYGEKILFTNLNIDLKRGEKVALIGENGRGKTTLFKQFYACFMSNCRQMKHRIGRTSKRHINCHRI